MKWESYLNTTLIATLFAALSLAGCGAKNNTIADHHDARIRPDASVEICNGLDDDLDYLLPDGGLRFSPDAGRDDGGNPQDGGGTDAGSMDSGINDMLFVDEDFRDHEGRYVHIDHCGACNQPCRPSRLHEVETACEVRVGEPLCVATSCEAGFVPSTITGQCIPSHQNLCLACLSDADCGDFENAVCIKDGDAQRCAVGCELPCDTGAGLSCVNRDNLEGDIVEVCLPMGGSCECRVGSNFELACSILDPNGERCTGRAQCTNGDLSACMGFDEICDEVDNDCNGIIDDPFRDGRGAYILDIRNCGQCGVDCTSSTIPEGDLTCGGDPFAPTCVLLCPDVVDGIMPGDRIDADRDIANGCECTLTSLADAPGPVRTVGPALDLNCDGADGIVTQSFYVAPDGNDANPGSPTRPLATLQAAINQAHASLETAAPRPFIFVASGTYVENITLQSGVKIFGGYRRDFLGLDPTGFRVEVRATANDSVGAHPFGAALFADGIATETSITWMNFRGADTTRNSELRAGFLIRNSNPALLFEEVFVTAGSGGEGQNGINGAPGSAMSGSLPTSGEAPKNAREDTFRNCASGETTRGGNGGMNMCRVSGSITTIRGGNGGGADCPMFGGVEGSGTSGTGFGISGGNGGGGGASAEGPILGPRESCPVDVCCGLSDFTVTSPAINASPGFRGIDGSNGSGGMGCNSGLGNIDLGGDLPRWTPVSASPGSDGFPGSGGGGGGAGGGLLINFVPGDCPFPDSIGGAGGGGGAGGCGGERGTDGTSGGHSVAVLIVGSDAPSFINNVLTPADGGRGGDGGAGGDGGRGQNGGNGGTLTRAQRTTISLSGANDGQRGGAGGTGGTGGGGGGGCGGSSVGIWLVNGNSSTRDRLRSGNTFVLGQGGRAGRGGAGAAPGGNGIAGGVFDVL